MYVHAESLTLSHSEQPKLYGVLAVLSAIGLIKQVDLGKKKICYLVDLYV